MASMREEDLEQLYARLETPLCNVVFRWVWSMDEAQDVVQDAFVRLWRMRARVDNGHRRAADLQDRAQPGGVAASIAEDLALGLSRRAARCDIGSRPADESLSTREDRARVRAAVEALPEDLRQVIMLCEYSELGYDQIAKTLSIPAGTVGSRRHRALRRLREHLTNRVEGREPQPRESV